MTTSAEVSPT
uniref:Uncharacterized protein n=1 Tax=Arundo donax TaxID=35708 RepID=A0A0A9F7Z6_ARUDO